MLATTGFRNRWILFPIAITFPGERIQKNWAGHSELFIIYMWICNINIGFMLWFHDLFIVSSVGGLFPTGNFSSPYACSHAWFPSILPAVGGNCGKSNGEEYKCEENPPIWAAAHIYIPFKLLGHCRHRCNGCWAMIYGIVSGPL